MPTKASKTLAAILLLGVSCITYAGEIRVQKEGGDIFKHFDGNESISELTIQATDDYEIRAQLYKLPEASSGRVTSTLCVGAFDIDRVEKEFIGSNKTIYYNFREINATKIRMLRPVTTEDRKKLGLLDNERPDIGRLELTDGTFLYVLAPQDVGFVVCGIDASGKPSASEKKLAPAEYYGIRKKRNSENEGFCPVTSGPVYPALGSVSSGDTEYVQGSEGKKSLEYCRLKISEEAVKREDEKNQREKLMKEDDEKYEREKMQHKMVSGVDILGKIGIDRSQNLIARCLSHRRFERWISKYSRKFYKCDGYYDEEVEALQKEMRIRGLTNN